MAKMRKGGNTCMAIMLEHCQRDSNTRYVSTIKHFNY